MEIPVRLENAITKLYNAFHNGKLDALDSCACAVGNIVGNGVWRMEFRFCTKQYKFVFNIDENKKYKGYKAIELANVERIFLSKTKMQKGTKETQFKGLCAVVEYLCELDNIPNVMDYTKLFETENDKPKYALHENN